MADDQTKLSAFPDIDKFIAACNQTAAPFDWTKAVVHPTGPQKKYSDLCK